MTAITSGSTRTQPAKGVIVMTRHAARAARTRFGAATLSVVAFALVVGSVFVTGAGATPTTPAGSATYTDPAGDTPGAPDVTTVAIDGDPTTSMLTVTVNAPGYSSALPAGLERYVLVWLDTDRNGNTGDPEDGTEWGLGAWTDSTGRWWDVARWDGSDWDSVPQSATMNFTRSGDVLRWTISSSDLAGATGFRFYIHACTWDPEADEHVALDLAPDRGWWDYDISATTQTPPTTPPATPPATSESKVSLLIGSPSTTPKQAVAGKRFTVTFRVAFQEERPFTSIDIGTGETKTGWTISWTPVSAGKMVCDPSVAGKTIAHSESLKNGQARLSFVIPKAAKGKVLKVQVKITATEPKSAKALAASKVVTFRIK